MESLTTLSVPEQSDFERWRANSRKRFDILCARRSLGSRDGLDLTRRESFIPRNDIVTFLVEQMFQEREILMRAPPGSGKTSVAQLLYLNIFETYTNALPVLINCLKCDKSKSFEDQFPLLSGLGMKLKDVQVAAEDKKVIVIIDEAQLLYSTISTDIWELMKRGFEDNTFFAIFAAYGEKVRHSTVSTPYEFPKAAVFGLERILLAKEEFLDLVTIVCPELNPYEEAKTKIFDSCGGHIGLITTVFNEFIDYEKLMIQRNDAVNMQLSEEQVLEFLISSQLSDAIADCRSFALNNSVTMETMIEISAMFLDNPTEVLYDPSVHSGLVKLGIFVVKNNGLSSIITFSAPLIRRAFISHVLHYQATALGSRGVQQPLTTLKEFMMICLRNLRKDNFVASAAQATDGNLNEAKFKMEFFFIARHVLGVRARIDPEVGQVVQTTNNASVDFYINSKYQWAIEFLVQSDGVNDHLDRFASDGKYKPIPCKEFIVVDFVFRQSSADPLRKSKYRSNEAYMRVIYDETFTKLVVEHLDTPCEIDLLL